MANRLQAGRGHSLPVGTGPEALPVDLLPVPSPVAEPRTVDSRDALARRVYTEFAEMPGLKLSIEQAARLFGVPSAVCTRVFDELIGQRLMRRTADGRFMLAEDRR